jgi:hypothetical protein
MPLYEMKKEEKKRLQTILRQGLDLDVIDKELDEAVAEYNRVTENIVGRIPGDVHDLVLNYFTRKKAAESFPGPEYSQMEIGVLFGGSLILGMHANQSSRSPNHVVAIDPLDGYYMSDPVKARKIDKISNQPVDRRTLEQNLINFGIAQSRLAIHQLLSTSKECENLCSDLKLSFLFIDGDHSYEGIENDWTKFSRLVVDEGYVVIDNLNDSSWIGVNKYIYDMLQNPEYGNWGVRAAYRHTAILQKSVPHDSVAFEGLMSSLKLSEEYLDLARTAEDTKKKYLDFKRKYMEQKSKYMELKNKYKNLAQDLAAK